MYELVVGEGGCSAAYFMDRMSAGEARSYIEGLNRRYRNDWERTRLLGQLVHKVATGKDWELEFPWEREPEREREETTDEELAELRRKAQAMERMMNGG